MTMNAEERRDSIAQRSKQIEENLGLIDQNFADIDRAIAMAVKLPRRAFIRRRRAIWAASLLISETRALLTENTWLQAQNGIDLIIISGESRSPS